METVIIGIHGLRNKPPKYVLADWWKKSIAEGLRIIRLPPVRIPFRMAYWAHYMHPKPQDALVKDQSDPQYLWEPYGPGTFFGPREPQPLRRRLSADLRHQLLQIVAVKSGFTNIDAVRDMILHRMFIELDIYYHHTLRDAYRRTRPAKELLRDELARIMIANRGKSICVIAHSMGCIVAYDVLVHVVPDIPVHAFITAGAPLGFPMITKKIRQDLGRGDDDTSPLPTPESVTRRWLNLSDPDDVTCLDYNLRNHYCENSAGVRPFDQIVYNNFMCNGVWNPHKIYGYLRTAEMSQAIYNFLVLENASLWQRLKWVFKPPVF